MIRIAIFASGKGSNAAQLIDYFKNHPLIQVALVLSNYEKAGVLHIANNANITTAIIENEAIEKGTACLEVLQTHQIDYVILAGFLRKIPQNIIAAYEQKIVNIHPSLLPKYGGKGMYGMKVHEAVLEHQEKESGISIHLVNEAFDEGKILFQAKVNITAGENAASLQEKIHQLEHAHFATQIEKYITQQIPTS